MIYRILADIVVVAHLLFILFALLGGLLTSWRSYLLFLHLPAAAWVVLVSFKGWTCPLTPLENQLRLEAGLEGYSGGFIEHYIIALVYPVGLTPQLQVMLGLFVIVVNMIAYSLLFYSRQKENP